MEIERGRGPAPSMPFNSGGGAGEKIGNSDLGRGKEKSLPAWRGGKGSEEVVFVAFFFSLLSLFSGKKKT